MHIQSSCSENNEKKQENNKTPQIRYILYVQLIYFLLEKELFYLFYVFWHITKIIYSNVSL